MMGVVCGCQLIWWVWFYCFTEALFGAAPFACSTLEELHERVLDPRPVEVGVVGWAIFRTLICGLD